MVAAQSRGARRPRGRRTTPGRACAAPRAGLAVWPGRAAGCHCTAVARRRARPAATPRPTPRPRPPPSLADALVLPAGADVRAFMARNVAPEVRAAAVKKLFADPHFNVMDGLDIYIDDYTRPSPLPAALLREMQSAQALGLFDAPQERADEPAVPVTDTARVDAHPVTPDVSAVAPSAEPPIEPSASPDTQTAAAPHASRAAPPIPSFP
ncbi:MAG: DUF3306 domain-containing protein [Burkholderiaceae bacterium]|nr:MAG: DUF3306 domain-containing protein [Burkholderiaceae bacterium]